MVTSSKQKKRRYSQFADHEMRWLPQDRQLHMGRVMACLMIANGGGTAKTVTSHYHKECYNTLAHHVAGNFVLETYYETLEKTRQPCLEGGVNSPLNIIDHLPLENLFFDSRHWNIWKTCEAAPTITTRTDACNQQFLFEIHEIDNAEVR